MPRLAEVQHMLVVTADH